MLGCSKFLLCPSIVFEVSPPIKGIQEKSFMAFVMLSTLWSENTWANVLVATTGCNGRACMETKWPAFYTKPEMLCDVLSSTLGSWVVKNGEWNPGLLQYVQGLSVLILLREDPHNSSEVVEWGHDLSQLGNKALWKLARAKRIWPPSQRSVLASVLLQSSWFWQQH